MIYVWKVDLSWDVLGHVSFPDTATSANPVGILWRGYPYYGAATMPYAWPPQIHRNYPVVLKVIGNVFVHPLGM